MKRFDFLEYLVNETKRICLNKIHGYISEHPERFPLNPICEFCGSNEILIRHHPDYDFVDIYVTCCHQCHWWIHNR